MFDQPLISRIYDIMPQNNRLEDMAEMRPIQDNKSPRRCGRRRLESRKM